jgi:hypothetical protein
LKNSLRIVPSSFASSIVFGFLKKL